MAPKKGKIQGKRNGIKIKSKINKEKRGARKTKAADTPLETPKWLGNQCGTVPNWLNGCVYKPPESGSSSVDNSSTYSDYPIEEAEEKSSNGSGPSDECNCAYSKYDGKGGILKHNPSPTNSVMAKYIQTGMDHVASFIVESAIRFGEQHGVVVPDKNTPNVYEITKPDKKFDDKSRKIRFKIPDKTLGYEDAKKVMWRSLVKKASKVRKPKTISVCKKDTVSSWGSATDSMEEILPLLEIIKEGGEFVSSDLDLNKLAEESQTDGHLKKRDRLKDKFRLRGKRYKSVGAMAEKPQDEREYNINKTNWKKFRRDSLELGRQRLRASTCPRKQQTMSPTPY